MNILLFPFTDMALVCNLPCPRRLHIIFITSICILVAIIIIPSYLSIYHFSVEISQLYLPLCPYSLKIARDHIIFDDPSYSIHHYPEFVCPQNFRNLADWVYGWPENLFDEHLEYSLVKRNYSYQIFHMAVLFMLKRTVCHLFSQEFIHI